MEKRFKEAHLPDKNGSAFYPNLVNPEPVKNLYPKKLAFLLFISFTLITLTSNAKNYYIAASGSDANTGLSAVAAWKTIAKINASFSTFLAGDSILFKRGDTFYGTITIAKTGTSGHPLVFSCYGTGAKPVVTGFTTISGWTNEGNGIYSKVITSAALTNMVTVDGVQYAMGRYPDAGYLTYQTFSTNTSITDNKLGSATNWTSAEVAIRKNDWTIDRSLITNHSGNTLTYTTKGSSQSATANFGYFIQNDLRTLTKYGEWYHNTSTGKFYMYFGSVDPSTKTVKVATINNLVYANGNFDYITLTNIAFNGSIDIALNFQYSQDYCIIQNNDISFVGGAGINFLDGCTADVIDNNTISYCNRSGIVCNASVNSVITNNIITNIGQFAGQAIGSNDQYEGVYTRGDGVTIRYNTIRNTGYNGITLKYTGAATIQYNLIDSACTVLDDGGGIYTPNPNTSVRLLDHNIILNTIGNSDGTDNTTSISTGIYLDEEASNVKVTNNTLANIAGHGIKLHRASSNTLTDNTSFNDGNGIDFEDYVGNKIRTNSMRRNIFFSKTATQYPVKWYTVTNDINLFGTADSNYYSRPINDNLVFNLKQPSTGYAYKSIVDWNIFSAQDAHSKKSPRTITYVSDLGIEYNATNSPVTISFAGQSKIDPKGNVYNNTVSIPAWSSVVLINNGSAPVANKLPVANAGDNKIITLPTSNITLTGIGTDTDGTIKSYAWTKLSGPSSGVIVTPNTATTNINSLTQGVYQYLLVVADNNDAIGKDTVQVTVNEAANQAPQANAGTDNIITLPTNSITLTGTATDADGTVTIAWTKISGPTLGTIAAANAATTIVNNLTQGVYQFQLLVTDNKGAITKDTVQVIVNAAPNQAPIAKAGTDYTITLPANSVTLTGAATDADGTVSSYDWVKISGPLSGTIATANAATTVLNYLSAGIYQYELTVIDNDGAISKDTVRITVNPAPNQAPVANAGTDIVITLPKNFTSLTGTGTDTDGSVISYAWVKISGPLTGTIETANTANTLLSNLSEGFYQYELTVTDNNGAIAKDIVQITVNGAANQAPVANAGADRMITLPTNFTNLTGTGTDTDGTISNYSWAKIFGPSSGIIETANAANTALSNLSAGTYQFELTVTDNNGAIAKDIIQVTVNAAPNQLPVANAGADIMITLPTNFTNLNGTGTDTDGSISNYSWGKISGPSSGTIASPNAPVTVLNNLSTGIYQYELTVTDNNGAIAKDTLQVTVNAAINEMPVANAGPDKAITLPTNNIVLAGSGYDPNGRVIGYNWVKISGPSSGTITSSNAATVTVNNLEEGTYKFELTVTDNDNAISKDTVQVTVNAAAVINLRSAINPTNIVNGLNYNYYEGNWLVLPDFTTLTPVKTGITSNFSLSPAKQLERYGFSFSGFIEIPADGVYSFYTSSDDGSKLYIDNVLTVDNDGIHPALEKSGTIGLKAGKHNITGVYFQGMGGYNFFVSYEAAGLLKQVIPAAALYKINAAPTATAGADQSITLPASTVTFIGSGEDTDGTISSYTWSKISGPLSGTIATANGEITSVTNLVPGNYQFELTVKDNSGAVGKDTVRVTVNPAPSVNPVAKAGVDKVIILPANTTTLIGSAIITDGTISSYTWVKISGPVSGTISTPKAATTILYGLVHGVYFYELTVKDNSGKMGKDTISVIVNTAPIAKAGIDKIITLPINTVTLSGSGTDADGTISSYNWTKIYGPSAGSISSESKAITTVTNLDLGIYKFELTIKDNNGTIAKDTMSVTVNALPVARAGLDKLITLPTSSITLTGTASVAGGTITSYSWSRIAGSYGTIVSPNTATTSITNLVARGIYKFALTVKDNKGTIAKDTVQINVNTAPVAKAGADQLITMPSSITTVIGTGSDIGGTVVSYSWIKIAGSTATIVAPTKATTAISGLTRGIYKFELTVKDNDGAVAKDTMQIIVNQAPVAQAGADRLITLPTTSVILAGAGTDIGGTISGYSWVRIAGPAATIAKPTVATTTVSGLIPGIYKFEFSVKDNNGAIGKDTVEITVNQRPVAKAGADQLLTLPKNTATLGGTGTDAGGSISSYNWLKIAGPVNGVIANANAATTTLTGLAIGVYKYELTVKDNNGAIGKDTVTVTVNAAPVAKAGADQLVNLPVNTVKLIGVGTRVGGSISSYNWVKIAGPASGKITNVNIATTTVANLVLGVYKYELTVKDNYGALGKDTVQIIVNQAPVANAGADRSINLPVNSITLTGAGTDAGGKISSYSWAKISTFPGTIATANTATTIVKNLVRGVYKFELTVKDNNGAIGKDTVTVTVNAVPKVNAGVDRLITLPINKLTLSATASVDGATIKSYNWLKISGPASGTIASANTATTNVTNLALGTYKYQLSVTGSNGTVGKDTVQIIVNQVPVAKAGVDKLITLPTNIVTLIGAGTDLSGTISSYTWTRISGPTATIANAGAASTSVSNLLRGIYKFELTVKDNNGALGKDTMEITVNQAPVANAGVDKSITLPVNTVTLTGIGTDLGGAIIHYTWTKILGSTGTIATANAATTKISGLTHGVYKFELAVKDNYGAIGKDTVTITVNTVPVVKAGADQLITLPANKITLSGTASITGATISRYSWTKISGPVSGTIASANAATTTVTNLALGTYKYQLSVTGSNGTIGKDTVQIIVNQAPVAKAGADRLITLPANTVTLTGTGTDAGGTISSYTWTRISGPTATIANAGAATTAVSNLLRGIYKFELTVKDNNGALGKDTVEITVNQSPIANAGLDKSITLPVNTITLSGTGTDAGGTISSYGWVKIGASPGTIAVSNAATTAVMGLTRGVYKFELTVKDNNGAIDKDTVTITVNAALSREQVKDVDTTTKKFELSLVNTTDTTVKDTIQVKVHAPVISKSIPVIEIKNEMKVYPNPVRDIANVDITTSLKGKAIISVTDMSGKTVKYTELTNLDKNKIFKLDMSNLRDGYYIVTVRFEDGHQLSSKVVKYGGK